ncbi:MAG: hypothetical protein KJ749_01040 [Planctomycetes bacterium]|nr:hypothetical protein [Planctomycetota bacterium]
MRSRVMKLRAKSLGLLCVLGLLCGNAGCDFGTITTSMTLDGRDAIIQLIRGAVLSPIDTFITTAVYELLGDDEA